MTVARVFFVFVVFVFAVRPSTPEGTEAARALAEECPAEVTAIGAAMGKSRAPDGTSA